MSAPVFSRDPFAKDRLSARDRVSRSLDHRTPDRIPLDIGGTRVTGIHESAYRRFRSALGLEPTTPTWKVRYLQLPKIDEDFRQLLGCDVVSIDPHIQAVDIADAGPGKRYIDMWQCEWYQPPGGAYFDISASPLTEAESTAEVDRFAWPRGDDPALVQSVHTAIAEASASDGFPVLGRTSPGVFEMLHVLCGHEKAYVDLVANTAISEAIMDHVLAHKLDFYTASIELLLRAGVQRFLVSESDDLGGQSGLLVSPDMYRRLVKPRHQQLFTHIKTVSKGRASVELHCCGAIRPLLPDLIESGVEVINPVQVSASGMDNTAALKAEFGTDLVFHGGGIDSQRTLPYGTPAEVRNEVERRIADLRDSGGFIFTPVHSVQHDVPEENFFAMLEAYYENAAY